MSKIDPILRQWAGSLLESINPSASFAEGTANSSWTDIDLFISLSERTERTLKEIYESLFSAMSANGYTPKRQNVSINIRVNGYHVDLVPAKRQGNFGSDHSLYRRKADTWTKTNVEKHVGLVRISGRQQESRVIKLWCDQKGLDFPSFYLEMTVIDALAGRASGSLSGNVVKVLEYLRDTFPRERVVDPANINIISDDLTDGERVKIKAAAERALAGNWSQFVV